jgi:hypothetical protein
MSLRNRVLNFIQTAQPGDSLALSTDACCELRQGIWLQAERATSGRRQLFIYCENETPFPIRYGGGAFAVDHARVIADRTHRTLED